MSAGRYRFHAPLSSIRSAARGSAFYSPVRRWRLDRLTRRAGFYPDWRALLRGHEEEWTHARESANGSRILIATSLGLHFTVNTIDSLMAVALALRGARVEILLCDRALPACQVVDYTLAPSVQRYAERGPQPDFCDVCWNAGARNYAPLGLPVQRLSEWTEPDDATPLAAQDESATAGALRFFGKESLGASAVEQKIMARYAAAAAISARAARRLIAARGYDAVIAHHGIYVPQGPIADAARDEGVRMVTWHAASRNRCVIMEHGDTYHRSMVAEPAERWDGPPLSPQQRRALHNYLESRADGSKDWISFQREGRQERATVEAALGLSLKTPTALLVGSVAWDARLHYPQNAFAGMFEWTATTIRHFIARPDRQLVIRCHPGEYLNSPRAQDRLADMISRRFPLLPPNIVVVPPDNSLNTYAIAEHCAAVLVYNSKMGVELAARGKPVIVAGDAWLRGKGFSWDAEAPGQYENLLERFDALGKLDEVSRARAERYAYHFFFRRSLQIGALEPKGWPLCTLADNAFALSRPGGDAGIDTICSGILNGTPFERRDDSAPSN